MGKKFFYIITMIILVSISIMGCGKSNVSSDEVESKEVENNQNIENEKKVIKVGTRAVSEAIVEAAREDFEAKGYEMEIVIFDDAITPNMALSEGSIDANLYQHLPYLENYNSERGTDLTYTGKYIYYSPIQMFSSKIKSIDELSEGSKVIIPNDATNQGKALGYLVKEGLIKLREGIEKSSVLDITENKLNLEFIEMEQTQIPVSIDDVDAIVVNLTYMVMAGLDPKSTISNYASGDEYPLIIAIRSEDKEEIWVNDFEDSVTTDYMRKFFEEEYEGVYIPMF